MVTSELLSWLQEEENAPVLREWIPLLLRLAGAGQLVLIVASLAIPKVLGWAEDTAKLKPLTRQVFWTYAVYIWTFNLSFGVVSALAPGWLLDGTPLATSVCAFIALYWLGRLGIQLFYFDNTDAPKGWFFTLSEWALTALFAALAFVYGAAAAFGMV